MFFRRAARPLLLLLLVVLLFTAVAFYILTEEQRRAAELYDFQTTLAIETAVARALFDATRTAESPLPQYRLIRLGQNEPLLDVALRYNTTVEVLRMANRLLPSVDFGSGTTIIVPEGVQALQPARSFSVYTAVDGDTLTVLAARYGVSLDLLERDNPVLAERGIIPGDIVFIPEPF